MGDKRCSLQVNMTWKENYKNEVEKIFLQMLASISHQYYFSLKVFWSGSECSICRIPALRKWNQKYELTENLCYYSVSFHLQLLRFSTQDQSVVSLRTDTTLWSDVENIKRKIILMRNWRQRRKKYLFNFVLLIPNWNFSEQEYMLLYGWFICSTVMFFLPRIRV